MAAYRTERAPLRRFILGTTQVREHKTVEAILRREAEERGALAEIGRVISSSPHIDEIYEKFGEQVRRLVPWDRITVVSVDVGSATERIAYVAGVELEGLVPGTVEPLAGNPVGDAVTGRTGLILNRQLMGRYRLLEPNLAGGLISLLCVPLIWRDQPIGALVLQSLHEDAYSARDLSIAERVGAQIAGAIANAQLHEVIKRHAVEREVIAEIGRIIASSLHIEDVHKEFAGAVRSLISFDRLEISVVDGDRRFVRRQYLSGAFVPWIREAQLPLAGTVTELVVNSRSSVILSAAEVNGSHRTWLDEGTDAAWETLLAVPLITRNEVVGSLCLFSTTEGAYAGHSAALAERIGAQIAGTIANSELHSALRRTADERAIIAELWRRVRPGLGVAELCEAVAQSIGTILAFDRFVVTLAGPVPGIDMDVYVSGPQDSIPASATMTAHASDVITRRVLKGKKGVLLAESANGPDRNVGQALPTGFNSGVSVPLISGDDVIGAWHLQAVKPDTYSERHLETAERVAEHFGRAIGLVAAFDSARRSPIPEPSSFRTDSDHSWARRDSLPLMALDGQPRSSGRIPIVIFDRMAICRKGYAALFRNTRLEIVADVSGPEEATEIVARLHPSLILFEAHGSLVSSLEELAAVPFGVGGVKALIIAEAATSSDVRAALRSGANGFLLKSVSPAGLIAAIERVASGGTVLEPELLTELIGGLAVERTMTGAAATGLASKLSKRDCSILSALARGLSNSEIGEVLGLSAGTIRNRLIRIYQVLGVTDRAAAVHRATKAGIV